MLNVELNEVQGQNEVMMAEDGWVSCRDYKKIKAGRQIYLHNTLIQDCSLKGFI